VKARVIRIWWNVTYMRIEHVALWTSDLDRSKEFYTKFFGATSCHKYVNPIKKTGDVFPEL
jgi:lactoylglutathione lyase